MSPPAHSVGAGYRTHRLFCWLLVFLSGILAFVARASASTEPPQRVSVVNLLILYTAQARAGAGGTSAIRRQIDQAILEANEVFQNSHANVRIHLSLAAQASYQESGSVSTDLERLRNPTDGFLDIASKLRDAFGADLVCLITETGNDWIFYGLQGPSANHPFSKIGRA